MRFVSSARQHTFVVPGHAALQIKFPDGTSQPKRGLRAKFYNHLFDSENAQAALGWTDEERSLVEKHLITCNEFNRPGGIFLESDQDVGPLPTTPVVAGRGQVTRCIAFFPNENKEIEQCPLECEKGSEYCSQHTPRDQQILAEDEPVSVGATPLKLED